MELHHRADHLRKKLFRQRRVFRFVLFILVLCIVGLIAAVVVLATWEDSAQVRWRERERKRKSEKEREREREKRESEGEGKWRNIFIVLVLRYARRMGRIFLRYDHPMMMVSMPR